MTTPIEIDPKVVEVAKKSAKKSFYTDGTMDAVALAVLQSVAPLLVAGERATEDELLTIIARSIGRTIHVENFHARARDVLESIRTTNLEVPQPSKIVTAIRQRGKHT